MSVALAIPERSHRWARDHSDFYVEPEWCSERLFEVERFEGGILDPACGIGRVVEAARGAGLQAEGSDIVQRTHGVRALDFLDPSYPLTNTSNIVSNPPFDLFKLFARRALAVATNKVALIWLVRRLNAARWLTGTPLARIYLLTPRPSMPPGDVILRGEKPGGGKQDFCWLVWERGHQGRAAIEWLPRNP